jgi:preprotein translocase subunit SecY
MGLVMDNDNEIMAIFFFVSLIGATIFTILLVSYTTKQQTKLTVQYDCRLAEISVDYPQQVKEQCRRLLK